VQEGALRRVAEQRERHHELARAHGATAVPRVRRGDGARLRHVEERVLPNENITRAVQRWGSCGLEEKAGYRMLGMANLDGSLLSNFCLPVPTRIAN
jgi:hypothetical protein